MMYELKLAVRRLRSQSLLTAVCVGIIALGIATTTALFSVTDGLLFKPLPFRNPERLLAITTPFDVRRRLRSEDLRVEREKLDASPLIAESAFATPGLLFDDTAAATDAGVVQMDISPNLFSMLGVAPIRGHIPEDASDAKAAPAEVLLGYGLWRSQFGADDAIVGQVGTIGEQSVRVMAVMPPHLEFPFGANVWRIRSARAPSTVPNYARVAPDVTIEQVQRQFPRLNVRTLRDAVRPAGASTLGYLLGANSLVMIVAWIQVGGLLVSRTAGRATDIGIRLALGASYRRLLWGVVAEAFTLATASLVVAWAVTPFVLSGILRLLPAEMIRGQAINTDWRSFLFGCVVSALGVWLLTLFPLRIVRQSNPSEALQGRSLHGMHLSASHVRTVLVVAQLTLTCLLLYVAGLALQSFRRVTSVDLGFVPDRVIAYSLPVSGIRPGGVSDRPLISQALEEIRKIPGVASAAGAVTYPTQRGALRGTVQLPGQPGFEPTSIRVNHVTGDFFRTLGIRMMEGRDFDQAGSPLAPPPAIINQALADMLRPFGTVIDQTVQVTALRARIIGVVGNYVDERADTPRDPQIFFPHMGGMLTALLVRYQGEPGRVVPPVQSALVRLWGQPAETRVVHLRSAARRTTADYRGRVVLLGALAFVAMILALAGVAGTLSYAIRQRRREMAIHIALGAEPSAIRRRVVRWAMLSVCSGALIGVAGGAVVARFASTLWFGVGPLDLFTVLAVTVLIVLTGLAAAHLPAREAARVDPALVLRDP